MTEAPIPPTSLHAHAWQTLRLLCGCALAYAAGALSGLPEIYWAVITAVIVTQPMLSDTLAAGRERIVGTLIGAAVGFLVLALAQRGLSEMVLFWTALAVLAVVIAVYPYLRLSAVTLVVVVLVPGNGATYSRPFDRVAEILLGTIAAIIIAAVFRPWRHHAAGVPNERIKAEAE